MADFVWTGASSATWTTGSNWKVAGVAQANPPTNADRALFGTGTGATNAACTTAAGSVCKDLVVDNAYSGTLTLLSSGTALAVKETVTFGTGMVLASAGSNAIFTLNATTDNSGTGWAFTTNGVVIPFRLRPNGAGGRWALQDNLTSSAGGATPGSPLQVTAGTFDANNKNVTFTAATNSGVTVDGGTLILGTGTWSYSSTSTTTFFTYTSGTVTGGNETHSLVGTGNLVRTFAGGGQIYGTIRHDAASGTGAFTVTGANTFTAIGNVSGRTVTVPASTTTTVNGANGLGGIKGTLKSSTAATAATINLTSTQVSVMRAATLQDITLAPAGHAYALDASVSTSGNTGITFNTPFGWGIAA